VAIRNLPILTEIYADVEHFAPQADSTYIAGRSVEARSEHAQHWGTVDVSRVRFVHVIAHTPSDVRLEVNGALTTVSLRSGKQLNELWRQIGRVPVYLDITGLPHHVWAPLLRAALSDGHHLMVVYVEPNDYSFSTAPTEGEIFDLSEKISGVAPIPGFVSLRETDHEAVCFVPLLGFEGTRLAYILEQVQPPGMNIIPIVGVPGFRPEYPFYTYLGNRTILRDTKSWGNARFATANDPFSVFYLLTDIAEERPHDLLKIAPIGTKPHALGAMLYAVTANRNVEFIYDHPIRKARRTNGTGRVLVYHVSSFART